MKRLLAATVCGALSLSASAALASGGYITGEMSSPPRTVFSAPAPVAAPVYAAPACQPCAPAVNPCPPVTTYMPAAPAPCSTCATPVVAQSPCTSCAPAVAFSPVVAPACSSCAPAVAYSPVVTYSPVVQAYSPVMRVYSPVVPAFAPIVTTPVFGRRAILRTPVVLPAAPVVYGY